MYRSAGQYSLDKASVKILLFLSLRIAQNLILELVLKADRGSKVKPRLIDTSLFIDNPKHKTNGASFLVT